MSTPDTASAPWSLLYVGGTSRSGSTLLECLLARLDDVVVLGEVTHLWQRGLVENQLCACRRPFSECPFWRQVGERAFGGWDRVDAEHVLALKDAVDRQRRIPLTARRNPPERVQPLLEEYADHYRRIYGAAARITGASVVVDSSKIPPTALCLSHHDGIDMRVLHIVRDSRGVAYSWTKVVARPEAAGEAMPRYSIRRSATEWLSHNLEMGLLAHRGVPVVRIRYEDLVEDAASTVAEAWRELALPGPGRLPMTDRTTIELRDTHSVAGNPMRFALGTTTLRPDDAWRTAMAPRDRKAVTAMTYPVLRLFGYR
jgi:hypothetical protein